MENLSYVGNKEGLMNYIRSLIPNCDICKDEGFIEKTEWSDTDSSYDVTIKCECAYD
jgi:hypothetical protein